jgi:hypothetical protein
MTRRCPAAVMFLLALAGPAGVAQAEVVQYLSRHPLPKRVGHGFCDIDVPHFHDYPPSDPRLYRQVNGQLYFVGDPTPFEYDGPRYSFYGPHPITDANVQFGGPTYCYLRGPHYHWYAPPPQAQFELRGGAYWYVGAYDPVYYSDEPRFVVVNEVYAPMIYARPVIDVRIAPPGFRGEIVVGGGPGWRGGPVMGGPGFRMGGPPPGPGRREMVMREQREQEVHREQEHRGWEHGHGPGWHGGPPKRGAGWRGGSPEHGGGWHGSAPERAGGWRGGPPPTERGPGGHASSGWRSGPARGSAAPAAGGYHAGGPHPGGGGPRQAPHGNGFHR